MPFPELLTVVLVSMVLVPPCTPKPEETYGQSIGLHHEFRY